ncbi:NAD(+) diphosphatase [Methanoregula formicica]|uniref:NAD(+) diphosphatase n=1 Tax=Methanoregula formicica (strain DSM 22288 / NBRC 105244 / SMSP) TaxID=593750 RepID=L0HHM7_METFS|nr:NAD(+) diphosphatase [Methanoregula formicica]AGB03266.1 Zn-finger containing NTP pyrophosphohydrolase [Methanoregula formicica SMSP]
MATGFFQQSFPHTAVFSSAFLEPLYPEPAEPPENAEWVIVRENGVYLQSGEPPVLLYTHDKKEAIPDVLHRQYLGHQNGVAWYAMEVAADTAVPGSVFYPDIRGLHAILPDNELAVAALAVRIIAFDRTTRFCGLCGSETRQSKEERAKVCAACGQVTYPRMSPAIIVLIRKDDQILLARSPRFPPKFHSVIAGFVAPGETLEEAVRREVREEVGIEIANIRYLGSEPWPFPDSLMIGFVADYAGGEIVIDNNEIVSAGWFDRASLPELPRKMSIARALIDWWLAGENEDSGQQKNR